MKVINQSWEWIQKPVAPLEIIEKAGRTCYKSEDRIAPGSAEKFAKMVVKRGHETVIEHAVLSVRFITNRGVTHELVRHRLSSFSQESTRYIRYKGGMEFIRPVWWDAWSREERDVWEDTMRRAEIAYQVLLDHGSRPEQAREVLPNSLKTEIVMTANLREWRNIFNLRCDRSAHPQIRCLMLACLKGFAQEIPIIFDDLGEKYVSGDE